MVKDLQFETLKKSRSRKSVTPHLVISWWIHSLELPPPKTPGCKTPSPPGLWTIFLARESQAKPSFVTIASSLGGVKPNLYHDFTTLDYFRTLFILEKIIDLSRLLVWFVRTPFFFLGWLLGTAGQLARILDPILQVFGFFFGESKNPQGTMPFSTTKNQRRNWGGWEVFRIYLFLL